MTDYSHRIIVNELGQIQVTRLADKELVHQSGHFNKSIKSKIVYCEDNDDNCAVKLGLRIAGEYAPKLESNGFVIPMGKESAVSHLMSFSVAAYFFLGIFFILLLIWQ